ncbi:MAG: hypothetical protein H0W11_13355 [Gemmatimonadetes bacterium]|nr:hypothetical protein [Gemmatimonadota bacterium]
MATQLQEVRRALEERRTDLLDRRNVVAVGVGRKVVEGRETDQLAIVASVIAKRPREALPASELIPPTVDGVPTDVVCTGPIFAFQNPTGRFRPAPAGVSLGHVSITAGTLGCLVRKNGRLYILSNNHVIANSNDAAIGDPILQPGPTDGGRDPADRIGRLSEWVPIQFDNGGGGGGGGGSPCAIANAAAGILNAAAAVAGSSTRLRPVRVGAAPAAAPAAAANLVDCAIAEPLDQAEVSSEILQIGTIAGLAEGALGMSIKKSGRTTGLTTGTIQQIDVTVQVSYGPGRVATFVDQLLAGPMSQGGDSGSAVLNDANQLVGLLFAGSINTTIMNRIQNVFQALQVSLP